MNSKQVLKLIAEACDEKSAHDITILDMDKISLIADYFLICHASNERQVLAVAKEVRDTLFENEIGVKHMEGQEQARWIVIDTGSIICHIFHEEERKYYNLERLWGDASEVSLPELQKDLS